MPTLHGQHDLVLWGPMLPSRFVFPAHHLYRSLSLLPLLCVLQPSVVTNTWLCGDRREALPRRSSKALRRRLSCLLCALESFDSILCRRGQHGLVLWGPMLPSRFVFPAHHLYRSLSLLPLLCVLQPSVVTNTWLCGDQCFHPASRGVCT